MSEFPSSGRDDNPARAMSSANYQAALGFVVEATRDIAERKNVHLDSDGWNAIAESVLNTFREADISGLLCVRNEAIALAAQTINRHLDILAGARVAYLLANAQGEEHPDTLIMIARGEAIVAQFAANAPMGTFYRWPEPAEAVRDYLTCAPSGRVDINLPGTATVRATYFLKRAPHAQPLDNRPVIPCDEIMCLISNNNGTGDLNAGRGSRNGAEAGDA
jgi:hypothetical protein